MTSIHKITIGVHITIAGIVAALLLLFSSVVGAADFTLDQLPTARNARAQVVQILNGTRQRTSAITDAAQTLEVKWSLAAISETSFGFFENPRGTNVAAIAINTPNLTCANPVFVVGDVGKTVDIAGAGPAGATMRAIISAYVSANAVTLDTNASTAIVPTASSAVGHAIWGWFPGLSFTTTPLISQNGTGQLVFPSFNFSGLSFSGVIPTVNGGTGQAETIEKNVVNYGAIAGDGVDDSAAINAAVTATGTGGGIVRFPSGTFDIISTRIQVRKSNVVFRGNGKGATTIQWSGALPAGPFAPTGGMITFWPSDAIYPGTPGTNLRNNGVESMTLIGKGELVYTAGSQGVEFENVIGGYVRDCRIINFGAECILFDAALGNNTGVYMVESNEVSGGGNFFNTGGSAATTVRGNYFHDNVSQGVEMASSGQNTVTGNIFKNMTGNIEILMDRAATARSGTVFSGNTLEHCQKVIVNTQSGSQPTNVIVANNVFRLGQTDYNINVFGGANTDSRVLITGNCISETVNGGGVGLTTGYGGVITNNLIFNGPSGSLSYGINGDVNAKAIIYGNTIHGCTPGNEIVLAAPGNSVVGENVKQSTLVTPTSARGNVVSIADDAISTLMVGSDFFNAAGAGELTVNARGNGVDGITIKIALKLHVAGCTATIMSQNGSANGKPAVAYNTDLVGTTGGDNQLNVSAYGGGGLWKLIVENRTSDTVTVGWSLNGYSY